VIRGEVVWLRSTRGAQGREQRGQRYGVVLQSSDLLGLSTVVVAPTSTHASVASFRPEVTIAGSRTRVLVDQLTAMDWSRIGRSKGVLPWTSMREIDRALELVLGLAR
jgi:mRNA interferase MazF